MAHTGQKLGRYTLHESINEGGMSEIWLATDEAGRPFAVRVMKHNTAFAFAERKRFNSGAETLQACQDGQFIIGYVEHGKLGDDQVLVLEYVEGSNLKLLMAAGDLIIGWLLLRQAEIAEAALAGATDRDRVFYTGKVETARWFIRNRLPLIAAERAVAESTDLAIMDLPEEAF